MGYSYSDFANLMKLGSNNPNFSSMLEGVMRARGGQRLADKKAVAAQASIDKRDDLNERMFIDDQEYREWLKGKSEADTAEAKRLKDLELKTKYPSIFGATGGEDYYSKMEEMYGLNDIDFTYDWQAAPGVDPTNPNKSSQLAPIGGYARGFGRNPSSSSLLSVSHKANPYDIGADRAWNSEVARQQSETEIWDNLMYADSSKAFDERDADWDAYNKFYGWGDEEADNPVWS